MANIPTCPNFLEGACERSELVLAGESEKFWSFICRCCYLHWVQSKPKEKARAQWQNEIDRMAKATEADRQRSARPSVFIAPRGGWN